ncbi:MAG: poly-gamma-glutamate hydrolase family protein [Elusimicrobia bacterium]|nr:poly-gamma-glutamate hydrolase family protein [Elusimicrobiota bacterium]
MRSILLGLSLLACAARAADRYPSVAALRAGEEEGKAFRVEAVDRHAPVTVLAIHGGSIEKGTSALARAIAGEDWSLYLFEGLLGEQDSKRLHVTSSHFDDPPAVALATQAWVAVSLHGEGDSKREVCVGGGHAGLREAAAAALTDAGFSVEEPCARLPGINPVNIVNRAKEGGLQLELTGGLRARLAGDRALRERFVMAVRKAAARFAKR